MSRFLVIDSTLPGLGVGVGEIGSGALGPRVTSTPEQGSSTRLAGMVERVMESSRLTWAQMEGILVATGPGSFTGIRMSLAFAYGVKLSIPTIKLAGTSSLVEMARDHAASGKGDGAFVLPGTRDQGFVVDCSHGRKGGAQKFFLPAGWRDREVSPTAVLLAPWAQFEAWIRPSGDGDIGPANVSEPHEKPQKLIKLYGHELLEYSLECLAKWGGNHDWGQAAAMNEWPRPNYLRASTAEENLMKKGESTRA